MGPNWSGSEKVELKENTILLKNSSQKQPNNNQLLWRLFKEKRRKSITFIASSIHLYLV